MGEPWLRPTVVVVDGTAAGAVVAADPPSPSAGPATSTSDRVSSRGTASASSSASVKVPRSSGTASPENGLACAPASAVVVAIADSVKASSAVRASLAALVPLGGHGGRLRSEAGRGGGRRRRCGAERRAPVVAAPGRGARPCPRAGAARRRRKPAPPPPSTGHPPPSTGEGGDGPRRVCGILASTGRCQRGQRSSDGPVSIPLLHVAGQQPGHGIGHGGKASTRASRRGSPSTRARSSPSTSPSR